MAEDRVDIILNWQQTGQGAVQESVKRMQTQLANLGKINLGNLLSTGKGLQAGAQQIAYLKNLANAGDQAAGSLANLRQQDSAFTKIFAGNSKQNLSQLLQTRQAFVQTYTQLGGELNKLQRVSLSTGKVLTGLTSVDKFRIMGHVVTEELSRWSQKLITVGKQMQWVGRQMIVGMTIPIVYGVSTILNSYNKLNAAQVDLQKYLAQSNVSAQQFAETLKNTVAPEVARISKANGLYADSTTEVVAQWVAAGKSLREAIPLTELTAQIQLLSGGELDLAGSMELVRSVSATYNQSINETRQTMAALSLIAGDTSLRMDELAKALPVVSSSANLLKISAGEVAAMLAGMRNQGVPASQAANTLKFSINRLINPTTAAKKAFAEFFKTTEDGLSKLLFKNGEPQGIQSFIKLSEQFQTLNAEQQGILAGQLFGGYRADRMLKFMAEAADGTSQFAVALKDANDQQRAQAKLEEQLSIVRKSSAFQFQQFRIQMSLAFAKIGQAFVPTLAKLADGLIKLLDKMANAPASTKKLIVGLAGIMAALGPLTFLMAQFRLGLGTLIEFAAVNPLRKLFSITATEDVAGLNRLALQTKNRTLMALAGLPQLDNAIAASTSAAVTAQQTLIDELALQGLAVDALKEKYLELEAVQIGGAEGLARRGTVDTTQTVAAAAAADAIEKQKALRVAQINSTKMRTQAYIESLTAQREAAAGRYATAAQAFQVPYSDRPYNAATGKFEDATLLRMKQEHVAIQQQLQSQIRQAEANMVTKVGALRSTLETEMTTISSKVATEGVVAGEQFAAGMSGGVATGLESQNFKTRIAKAFTSIRSFMFGNKTGLIGSASQTGGFSLFRMKFGGALGIGALLAGLGLGGLMNAPSVSKGFEGGRQQGSNIVGEAIKDMMNSVRDLRGGDKPIKNINEAWKAFGETLGKVYVQMSKVVAFIIRNVVPIASFIAKVFTSALEAITGFFHIFTQGTKAFKEMASGGATVAGVIGKLVAVFAAFVAVVKGAAFIQRIVASFKLLGTVMKSETVGIFGYTAAYKAAQKAQMDSIITAKAAVGARLAETGANEAVTLSAEEMALAEEQAATAGKAAALSNPILTIITVIGTALLLLTTFMSKSGAVAQAVSDNMESITSSLDDVAKAAKKAQDSIQGIKYTQTQKENLDTTFRAMLDGFDQLNKDITKAEGGKSFFETILGTATDADSLNKQLKKFFSGENLKTPDYVKTEMIAVREQLANLDDEQLQQLRDILKVRVQENAAAQAVVQKQIIAAGANETLKQKYVDQLVILKNQLMWFNAIQDAIYGGKLAADALTKSYSRSADYIRNVLAKMDNRPTMKKKGQQDAQAYQTALENQLKQLMGRVTAAITDEFDKQTQDHLDALDKQEKAQVDSIDKQIDQINKQDDAEQKLQDNREYRQQREELLLQKELSAATAYRERLKAIHEGRFDDARLISLQLIADQQKANDDIKNLDKTHNDKLKKDRRSNRIDQLNKEKDNLQEQFDKQREAYQKMRDRQKTFLENMLDEIADFEPRNTKEWQTVFDQMAKVAGDSGVKIGSVLSSLSRDWGMSIQGQLHDALHDAAALAARDAEAVGKAGSGGFAKGFKGASDKDIGFMNLLADFMDAQSNAGGKGLSASEYASWMRRIAAAMQGISKEAKDFGGQFGFSGVPGGGHGPIFHGGGYVGGASRGKEVSATVLSNEFVMQPKAVDRIGVHTLNRLNNLEFHDGGFVGNLVSSRITQGLTTLPVLGGALSSAFAATGAVTGSLLGSIGTTIGGSIVDAIKAMLGNKGGGGGHPRGGGAGPGGTAAGPFKMFPVGAGATYGDGFGAPRYGGGYHQHAGIDIMAPLNTPIFSPLSGYVSNDTNGLGGNAFKLAGPWGYIYGAHLNKFGALNRQVNVGANIGYVGNTGDAAGGPTHLHFEYHPNPTPTKLWKSPYNASIIDESWMDYPAIDSYPYLKLSQGINPGRGFGQPGKTTDGHGKGGTSPYGQKEDGAGYTNFMGVPGGVVQWFKDAINVTGVPNWWLAPLEAMGRYESGYTPSAQNGGALGLMQSDIARYTYVSGKHPDWNMPNAFSGIWDAKWNIVSAIGIIKDIYGGMGKFLSDPLKANGPWEVMKVWGNEGYPSTANPEYYRKFYHGYGDGGIVQYPQLALIGEKGPEAVINLTKPTFNAPKLIEAMAPMLRDMGGISAGAMGGAGDGEVHVHAHFEGPVIANEYQLKQLHGMLSEVGQDIAQASGMQTTKTRFKIDRG